jgi:hypothetical protein
VTKCWLFIAICMSFAPLTATGQVTIGPEGPVSAKPAQEQIEDWQRVRLTVAPAAEPQPALQYSFCTPPAETTPGNGVAFYYRAFAEMGRQSEEDRIRLSNLIDLEGVPDNHLVTEKAGELLRKFEPVIEQLALAVRRETCDWQWSIHRELDAAQIMRQDWPELRMAREVARLLVLRSRWQSMQGDFAGATDSLRLGYQLAIDLGRSQVVVSQLVGYAIINRLNYELTRVMDTPGSPNFYWAIAELPRPLIDLHAAQESEFHSLQRLVPGVDGTEIPLQSAEPWRRSLFRLDDVLRTDPEFLPGFPRGSVITAIAMVGYPRAKRLLLDEGYTVEQLEAMPVGEVLARHQARVGRRASDDLRKWLVLPIHQRWKLAEAARQEFMQNRRILGPSDESEVLPITTLYFSSLTYAPEQTQIMGEVLLNAIQAIEAIRMSAAANHGVLPVSLDAVTIVPVPSNPASNQPFLYRTTEDGFELRTDAAALPEWNWRRFEVKLEK